MTSVSTIPSILPAAPRAGLGRLMRHAMDWHRSRMTVRAFSRLDAHLMRDVGLAPMPPDPHAELIRRFQVSW